MKTKEELRQVFENGDKPRQEDFWDWQDSYWHKGENIPFDKISEKDQVAMYDATKANYVMMKDGSIKEARDLGKNISNADLSNTQARTFTQNAGFTWDTSGNPYYLKGLVDKSADVAYNKIRVQNNIGIEAYSDGQNILINSVQNMSPTQKTAFSLALNPSMNTAVPYVSSASVLFFKKGQDYTINIYGSGLLLPANGSSVTLQGVTDGRVINSVSWSNNTDTVLNATFNIPVTEMNQNWRVLVVKGLVPATGNLQIISVANVVSLPITGWSFWKRSDVISDTNVIANSSSYNFQVTGQIPYAMDGLLMTAKSGNILPGNKNWELTMTCDRSASGSNLNFDFMGITSSTSESDSTYNLNYGFRFKGDNAGLNQDGIPIGGRFGGGENGSRHAVLKIVKIGNVLTITYDNGYGETGGRNLVESQYAIDTSINWAITLGKENKTSLCTALGTIQLLMN